MPRGEDSQRSASKKCNLSLKLLKENKQRKERWPAVRKKQKREGGKCILAQGSISWTQKLPWTPANFTR